MKFDHQNVFFISDTHFEHKKVIEYDKRPFRDTIEMRETIINNWNSKVGYDDIVYFLGDFSFGGVQITTEILYRLNGIIYVVLGNHDSYKQLKKTERFERIHEYGTEIYVKDDDANVNPRDNGYQMIILCHYPILVWNKHHKGSWMVHGHTHGSLQKSERNGLYTRKVIDVGCNIIDYVPLSYKEIKKLMDKRIIAKIDHH